MEIAIDRQRSEPVYLQIVRQVRDLILAGSLPEGFRLPPERRLAASLGVSRSTVLAAYRELKGDGLLDARVGRGTAVRRPPRPKSDGIPQGPVWGLLLQDTPRAARDPLIRDLLALSGRDDILSLSIGQPAPELLPVAITRRLLDVALADGGLEVLLHSPTEGFPALRHRLANWLGTRGMRCDPNELIILAGSQQGLDLVTRLLIQPGDLVVVEEPTYIGALQVFRRAGARLVGIPIDDNGLRVELLEELLARQRPKLIYTLPTFQNPSGTVMSLDRRRHLVDLSARHRVPILEDDPYSELRYEGAPLPSLRALDRHHGVLYLGTFSKLLFPGLRVGVLVAPRVVAEQVALLKQGADLHTSNPGQIVLLGMLEEGSLQRHLEAVRPAYRQRRDAMLAALGHSAGDVLDWRSPVGGFYVWSRTRRRVDDATLLAAAADRGVSFLPGSSCFPTPPDETWLRLNFTYLSQEAITDAVERLADAVRATMPRPPTTPLAPPGGVPVV
jgi:DNA-binding transcriptional MocR family regulator